MKLIRAINALRITPIHLQTNKRLLDINTRNRKHAISFIEKILSYNKKQRRDKEKLKAHPTRENCLSTMMMG